MDVEKLIERMSYEEAQEVDRLLNATIRWAPNWEPHEDNVPQCRAVATNADILLYGGSPAGGKTALLCGLVLTEHKRSVIFRRVRKHTTDIEEQLLRFAAVPKNKGFNSVTGKFYLPDNRFVELAGVKNVGDEVDWEGQAHDFKGFDQVEHFTEKQFRFLSGWLRTPWPNQRTRIVATANPPTKEEGRWVLRYWAPWLDPQYPRPAKDGELRWFITVKRNGEDVDQEVDGPEPVEIDGKLRYPLSRTFIFSSVEDNPYIGTQEYRAVLGNLPDEIRELMESGDFKAAKGDNPWQVIPSTWVDLAMERWRTTPRPNCAMTAMGVDPARGGRDKTVLTPRYENWVDWQIVRPGKATPDGQSVVQLILEHAKDRCPVLIDMGGGYGGAVQDVLRGGGYQHPTIGLNGAEKATSRDRSGKLSFTNRRSQWWWKMREALDPEMGEELCLPPDPELKADLCAPRWTVTLRGIQVESKHDHRGQNQDAAPLVRRLGRSPDKGDSAVYACSEVQMTALETEGFMAAASVVETEFGLGSPSPWEEGL